MAGFREPVRGGAAREKKQAGSQDPLRIGANIFISFIGAGILGLPHAFKKVRALTSLMLLKVVNCLYFFGSHD